MQNIKFSVSFEILRCVWAHPVHPGRKGILVLFWLSIILGRWNFLTVVTYLLRYPKPYCSVTSFKAPQSAELTIKFFNRVIYEAVPREISWKWLQAIIPSFMKVDIIGFSSEILIILSSFKECICLWILELNSASFLDIVCWNSANNSWWLHVQLFNNNINVAEAFCMTTVINPKFILGIRGSFSTN